MYEELNLGEVKARGWVRRFLQTQANGLTGNMNEIGKPFVRAYWEGGKDAKPDETENFLGGLNCEEDAWTPFEQNGYWIDGMLRTAYLSENAELLKKARAKIYPAVENADEDGYIGPSFLKGGMAWAHAVYFRALTAEYDATKNAKILNALIAHFKGKSPLSVYGKKRTQRIIDVRDVAEIETVLWLYARTGDEYFLNYAQRSYDKFNEIYSDDSAAGSGEKMRDLTVAGMLANGKANKNHGVTYCEICKLAAIMYLYTKNELYLRAAVNAFDKLERDQMLIDGVNSSTEYLNGNGDSLASHETCDVSDLTWAAGYLYMATGNGKYGDIVENAVFNGGLGCVDEDFKGQQYFSCPNQAIANDTSNHAFFFRGEDWMSYAPKNFLSCCAGNVHRFMPNFALRSWMKRRVVGGEKAGGQYTEFAAFTYAPVCVETEAEGKRITIEENTLYPFENTVKIGLKIKNEGGMCPSNAKFAIRLRKPAWAVSAEVRLNGKKIDCAFTNGSATILREFFSGDMIELTFEDKIELIENAGGVSVKKGALLYALPIAEREEITGLRDRANEKFPAYALYPAGKWNYCLNISEAKKSIKAVTQIGAENELSEPWKRAENRLYIEVPAHEAKEWKLRRVHNVFQRRTPRGRGYYTGKSAVFTPKVRDIPAARAGKTEKILLVPYAVTRLRIAIFPKIVADEQTFDR